MKDYLLIEKSKFSVKPIANASDDDKYVLEGVFTEFDSENRNGRVYTRKEFQPHFNALKKVVESGTAVGELDHPKQFETTLRNVSHKIEEIWMDEENNRVMGKIKLLDTDAGKQAKAIIDAGIPLHISSRAAGTVTEDKSVKIHKLFTYDLVDTPGFANARLSSVNESFGMLNENTKLDVFSDFAIYEIGKQIKQDIKELNNKNKHVETMDYLKESEFNKYTDFTKEAIEGVKSEIADMKEIQESIIEQNDGIVEEYSNAEFKQKFESVNQKLSAIENWADHVKEEFDSIKEANDGGKLGSEDETIEYHVGQEIMGKSIRAIEKTDDGKTTIYFEEEDEPLILEAQLAKGESLQVGQPFRDKGNIVSLEVQDDGSTKVYVDAIDEPFVIGKTKVDNIIDDETLQEKYNDLEAKFESMVKWSQHVTETVSAIEDWSQHTTDTVNGVEKWSQHVTETVSALEDWSDHATDTVSGVESWSNHVTESVSAIENWTDHVTESVSSLENSGTKGLSKRTGRINESKIEDFKESIYNKLENILEAKEQRATDNKSLNESQKVDLNESKQEAPLWMQLMPTKYKETWSDLQEGEKSRIKKRASLFNFVNESSIKSFWNNEFTKENLIREEKKENVENPSQSQLTEARLAKLRGFRMV